MGKTFSSDNTNWISGTIQPNKSLTWHVLAAFI